MLLRILTVSLLLLACQPTTPPAPAPAPHTHTPSAQTPPETEPEPALALETYALPKGYAEALIPMLKSLLDQGEDRVGKVSPMPGDRVAILAPAPLHTGIAKLIEEIQSSDAVVPPQTIALNYWLVVGRPGVTNASDFTAIAPALESINEVSGPSEFAMLETARLLSLNGEHAQTNGRHLHVEQRISSLGGHHIGELSMRTRRGNEINTRVRLEPEKLLVLGQTGLELHPDDRLFKDMIGLPQQDPNLTLYFIIRAQDVTPTP